MYTLNQKYKWPPYTYHVSSESKNCSYKIVSPQIIQGFVKTLQVISFQNDWYILHGQSPSKGNLIPKSHTFYYDIKYYTATLSVYIFHSFEDVIENRDVR